MCTCFLHIYCLDLHLRLTCWHYYDMASTWHWMALTWHLTWCSNLTWNWHGDDSAKDVALMWGLNGILGTMFPQGNVHSHVQKVVFPYGTIMFPYGMGHYHEHEHWTSYCVPMFGTFHPHTIMIIDNHRVIFILKWEMEQHRHVIRWKAQ